jgi:hypothetical protein
MRDVNGGPNVETIVTPQVVVGYDPTVQDLETYIALVDAIENEGFTYLLSKAHLLGRRIFGLSYPF